MTTALDRPLPMACWKEETDRDYCLVYGFISSLQNEELSTVRRSLYEKCLQGKHSPSCKCYSSAEKWHPDHDGAKLDDDFHSHKVVFDFMTVHRERALNAGKLNKDRGRRWRRKRFYCTKKLNEWERNYILMETHKSRPYTFDNCQQVVRRSV